VLKVFIIQYSNVSQILLRCCVAAVNIF